MKFTYDWLKDYLKTDALAKEIADELTRIGLEVEDLSMPAVPVAAKIIECEDIPDTHLHKLIVDDGGAALRQIVCGAPNVRCGLVSALARPGCKINGTEIKSGKLRGITSDGMMCSAKELGISDDHSGIIELDSDTLPGTPLASVSAVFDAGITPNRPDYLAVRGIARDLAAANAGEYIAADIPLLDEVKSSRRVIIENTDACPTYRMAEIRGIKIAPSDAVLAGRLAAIGINPKNAAIDATNYVCIDMAQPMHCFDTDEIKGDIIVRNAKAGEKFTDLFGTTHDLLETDLVISDAAGILALAGVVGGMRGMTTDKTQNIILESAYFNPVIVRKTSKRIGFSSDASYRYERGIDPNANGPALAMAAKIIMDACGGEIVGTAIAGRELFKPAGIQYAPEIFKKKTGLELSVAAQKSILGKLGFSVGDDWIVIPTSARVDVLIPENIVSELTRLYGYDKIKIKDEKHSGGDIVYNPVKVKLIARGLTESISYGFGDSQKEKMISDLPNVKIKNPIVANFDTARNSLVQNILNFIAENDRFKRSNLNLFELGTVFDGDAPGLQHDALVIARTGIAGSNIGAKHGRAADIYDVRDDLIGLFPGGIVENDSAPQKWANPYRAGRLVSGGETVARFAELHPKIAKEFGIKTRVVIGLVDNVNMIADDMKVCKPEVQRDASKNDFPEFPIITRDFAFIVDNGVAPESLTAAAMECDMRIIDTNIFDVFKMNDEKKSVAFEIVIQPESNMSDTDLMDIQDKIIAQISKMFNAQIRDK